MKFLLRTSLALLVLGLAWLTVVASGRLPRPTPEEIEALAAVRSAAAQVTGQRNAFAALYSFDHDVPEAEWEAVAAADLARLARHRASHGSSAGFEPLIESGYPSYPEIARGNLAMCVTWKPDCLLRVRADPDSARAAVALGRDQLARGDRLGSYDHYASAIRPTVDSPIGLPLGNYINLLLTASAVEHVDGNSAAALDRLCRSTAAWRRLRANADMLIMDMIGVAVIANASTLYAEILAELPLDFEPPCNETFAPLADEEMDQCPVFAHEFRMWENTVEDMESAQIAAALGDVDSFPAEFALNLVNEAHSVRKSALFVGQMCLPAHRERARLRSAKPLPRPELCGLSAWLFDPAGCQLFLLGVPNYDDYYIRVLDLDARLRLLGSAMWLRRQTAGEPEDSTAPSRLLTASRAAQFDTRPPGLDSPAHAFSIDPAAGVLRMRPIEKGRGEVWEIPLAPAFAPAAPGSNSD